jgi:hypothetical protein
VVGGRVLVNLLLAIIVVGGGWWLGIYASELIAGAPRAPNELAGFADFVVFIAPAVLVGAVVQQVALLAVMPRIPASARRVAAVISCGLIPVVWLVLSRGHLGLWGTWLGLLVLTVVLIVYGLIMRL